MRRLRIRAARARFAHERGFVYGLAMAAADLGHRLVEKGPADLWIAWSGTHQGPGPTIHCELAWLPRWWYQASPAGINARHHEARPELPKLTEDQVAAVERFLGALRTGTAVPSWGYTDPTVDPYGLDEPFWLCPLQVPGDLNLADVPAVYHDERRFIAHVLDDLAPAEPVIFKCHPATGAAHQPAIHFEPRFGRDDRLEPHHPSRTVHAYLKHPHCLGVITLNSNTVHDAILWGKPFSALYPGVWPEGLQSKDYAAYVWALTRIEWGPKDLGDEERVKRLIEEAMR